MKYRCSANIIFFISLLYLHCLPNNCDNNKQDASFPSENLQSHKVLPDDSSRIGNVPSQQTEAKKEKLGVKILQENVQFNVEYVNSIPEEKVTVNRIGQIPPVNAENTKLNEVDLKSSRSIHEPQSDVANNLEKDSQIKPLHSSSDDTTNKIHTEPLSDSKSHVKLSSEKLSKDPKLSTSATSTGAIPNAKLPEAVSEEKIEDNVHQQYDGMPSFDEWKKMMLAEQEKGGQKVPSPSPPGKKISSQKRRRNYSSYECGAKIVAANNEAEGTSRILNELVDEYMLNPCKAKIWFVIELCETVQASQIELANFELFSSCPKDFAVYASDNFPTRDWVPLGTFTAAEQRVLQSFELKQEGFGKFIKIELQSHYGEEHYCPLSVVRIFGTSMVDEYEEMETLDSRPDISDDDLDRLDIPAEDTKSTNIFGSATDAVMNIVKKAAQALGQQTIDEKKNETSTDSLNISETKACSTVDSSSEECKESASMGKSLSTLHNFPMTPTSMQQSLFRLLHRCDQCAASSIRYYSSAQPHCRFFQAALGPVMFQTICDWFKDNPLAVAHESPAPGKKKIPADTLVISPTKSPPPQIIRIPSESDLPLTELLKDNLSSIDVSKQSVTVNATAFPSKANKSTTSQDKIVLQSSIKPTQTAKIDRSSIVNESTKIPFDSVSKETIVPSQASIEHSVKESVTVSEKPEISRIHNFSEPATLSVADYTTSNEVLTESERQQINEMFPETNAVTSDDLGIEAVPATELPQSFKISEGKIVDMRNENQGKQEPVVSTGSTAAGQKESVFMRMSNRIKALEINMSLSSLYLQELSQRYRRQMDEMQRAFNRTVGTLNDTARKAAEKDLKQQEILNSLQLQVANLTETVQFLLNERTAIFRKMIETHVCLMFVEAIIMITIMSLCVRRISSAKERPLNNRAPVLSPSRLSKRRNSADSCSSPIARKVKKRSNSEENLNAESLLIVEPLPVLLDPSLKVKKKNRKRNKGIHRSNSHPFVQCSQTTSLCNEKTHNHSDGCMLCNVKPKQLQPNRSNHACENCDNNSCTADKNVSKERRPNSIPLQNLTNGSVIGSDSESNTSLNKNKEKFSFKKFLKFQKRIQSSLCYVLRGLLISLLDLNLKLFYMFLCMYVYIVGNFILKMLF